jgi:hypothetical protein
MDTRDSLPMDETLTPCGNEGKKTAEAIPPKQGHSSQWAVVPTKPLSLFTHDTINMASTE